MPSNPLRHSFGLMANWLLTMLLAVLAACGGGGGADTGGGATLGAVGTTGSGTTGGSGGTGAAAPSPGPATPDRSPGPALIAEQPIVVNTTVSGTQTLYAIGAQADGGYAVSWVSAANASAAPALFLQHYNGAGAKVGVETPVQVDIGALRKPVIAVTSDGGVLVVYVASEPVSAAQPWIVQWSVRTRRFDATGAAVGGETLVASFEQNLISAQTTYSFADPAVITWQDGRYLIGWSYVESSYIGSFPIFRFRLYDRLGAPVGDAFGAWHGDVGATSGLTAIPDGGRVSTIFYHDVDGWYALFSILSSTGQSGQIGAYYEPAQDRLPMGKTQLLPLADGRFVLWSTNSAGPYFRMFDRGGNPLQSAIPIASLPDFAIALSDGGYVTFTRDAPGTALDVQRYSSAGAPVGDPLQVQLAVNPWLMTTASLADGRLVLGWTAIDADGNQDVYLQRLQAP